MSCHQLWYQTFVYGLMMMSFITGSVGRRSCPGGRPTVDICTQGTVHGSETLLVDFSPEAGISACNCNLTIDGTLVDVTSVMAPQSDCGPQLEVELGVDYLEVDCSPINKSYNTSEVRDGNIWTTADVFYSNAQPQDLCLEFNVHGGASTLSITCFVQRNWEPSTTEAVPTSLPALPSTTRAVTLTPATSLPTTAMAGLESGPIAQNETTVTITNDIPFPPDHIRDELLKLAKNDENPVLFEKENLTFNATDSTSRDTIAVESTTSARIDPDSVTSGPTPSADLPPKDIMNKILELANATSNPVHIELPRTIPLENVTSDAVSTTTTSPDKPTETPGIPMVPPTDIMNQLLDIANNGTNQTIVFPEFLVPETTDSTTSSSLSQEQTTVVDESSTIQPVETTTTQQRQTSTVYSPTETPDIPMVPPTDIMNQLLDIANNGTNKTIVFPEFLVPETPDSTTSSLQTEVKTTTVIDESTTKPSLETSTAQQPQTTPVASSTETPDVPMVPPTDIMNQLLQIANNGTNDTIVFPEFPIIGTPDSTTSSSQIQEQTTVRDDISTVKAVKTSSTTSQTPTTAQTTTTAQTPTTTQTPTTSQTTTTAVVAETTTKRHLETTTSFSIHTDTGFDHTPFDEVPMDSHDDWTSYPDSTTPVLSQTTTTMSLKTAPRGDIEITTRTDASSPGTTTRTTDTAKTDDGVETTTLQGNDDVTGARNGTSPDDDHGAEDKLVVLGYVLIIVGAIIGIIVIVAIVAIIRAFCKSRRKSANITMMEKGGLENGAGATTGIDNPLVQLQEEQEMVETNPNPDNIQSGTEHNNGKMEANFSEGAMEMNGNGVSNSPQAGDDDVFQSSVNN